MNEKFSEANNNSRPVAGKFWKKNYFRANLNHRSHTRPNCKLDLIKEDFLFVVLFFSSE